MARSKVLRHLEGPRKISGLRLRVPAKWVLFLSSIHSGGPVLRSAPVKVIIVIVAHGWPVLHLVLLVGGRCGSCGSPLS